LDRLAQSYRAGAARRLSSGFSALRIALPAPQSFDFHAQRRNEKSFSKA
jgi:hypothetical protein